MSPSSNWPNSACGGTPMSSNMARSFLFSNPRVEREPARPEPSFQMLLDERALAFIERAERLIRGDRGAELVVVPRTLALLRFLHLEQIHVMDLAPVLADAALAEQLVVRRHRLHFRHDGGAVGIAL